MLATVSLTAPRCAGSDLFYEKALTLSEALCGFKFAIPHLDGRQLLVASNEGDVVKPGSFKAVYDEGMPTWQRPLDKGRLFIHFDVAFPEPGDLGDKEIAALADLLPPRPSLEVDIEACQEVSVSDVDMEQELRRQKERQMEDEDDEDPRGGRVQCAQQVRPACALLSLWRAARLTRSAAVTRRCRWNMTHRGLPVPLALNRESRKPLPCVRLLSSACDRPRKTHRQSTAADGSPVHRKLACRVVRRTNEATNRHPRALPPPKPAINARGGRAAQRDARCRGARFCYLAALLVLSARDGGSRPGGAAVRER